MEMCTAVEVELHAFLISALIELSGQLLSREVLHLGIKSTDEQAESIQESVWACRRGETSCPCLKSNAGRPARNKSILTAILGRRNQKVRVQTHTLTYVSGHSNRFQILIHQARIHVHVTSDNNTKPVTAKTNGPGHRWHHNFLHNP